MKDVVIVGALRTPIGCFQGALSRHSAVELGSVVVKALVEKTGIDPHSVDEVILGQVLTAGTGQNPARQSAIRGGLPNTVSAITINDVCGSGLKALHLATQAIQCGEADVVIAGGQENMSRAPHVLTDSRTGAQLGNSQLIDSLVHDGLWDAFNDYHMGVTAENLAREFGISRELQDAWALSSQHKARKAIDSGRFRDEIVPVVTEHNGAARTVDTDQAISVGRVLEWDERRVNVNGGAIALGHPIGASGCRILVSLVHEMIKRDARKGLATLCIGGGQGVALAVERA